MSAPRRLTEKQIMVGALAAFTITFILCMLAWTLGGMRVPGLENANPVALCTLLACAGTTLSIFAMMGYELLCFIATRWLR